MMDKHPPRRKNITAHANWKTPAHRNMWDLEFDPHPSLGYALWPVWRDPLIWFMTVLHLLAYAYFAYSLTVLPLVLCQGWMAGLSSVLPAAVAIQLVWGIKSVYLLDKASTLPLQHHGMLWRIVRTALLSMPFSFAPAWVIGCIAWPIIRINIRGGANFYDQSIVLGQYVQNSLWYIGAKNGSLRSNYADFLELTISQRSRYWDCASEQALRNAALGMIICFLFGAASLAISADATLALFGRYPLTGLSILTFLGFTCIGTICSFTNTTGLGALSILDYLKTERQIRDEPDLPPDHLSRWMIYVPHAMVGSILYALFAYVFLYGLRVSIELCRLAPA